MVAEKIKLDVPLLAQSHTVNDEQKLIVYHNGERVEVDAPVKPYIYMKRHPDRLSDFLRNKFWSATVKTLDVTPLGKEKMEKWNKVTFNNELMIKHINKLLRESQGSYDEESEEIRETFDEKNQSVAGLKTKFIDRVLIDEPDFFRQFTCNSLKTMTFDIEQLSDGEFPPQTNPLLSVSILCTDEFGVDEDEIVHIRSERKADGTIDDSKVVKKIVRMILDYDPDVLVGFHQNFYDFPVVLTRMKQLGIKPELLDRERRKGPWFYTKKLSHKEFEIMLLGGRISYDVSHEAQLDQALSGKTKDRKLKTLSKYFRSKGVIPKDVEIVEEDMHHNEHLLDEPEKLQRYNNSDVKITKYLFDMYIKNSIATAEFIGAPLFNVTPTSSSYPGTIVTSRVYKENGIISTGRNKIRNAKYWPAKGVPFQAAHSDCIKKGRFTNIYEADVSSLYPSIIVALGLGPDNCRIKRTIPLNKKYFEKEIGYKPIQYWKMEVSQDGLKRTYKVPDIKRNFIWEIEVYGQSVVASTLGKFLNERLEIKKQSQETTDKAEQLSLFTRAYGLKVTLNSSGFGMNGDEHSESGSLAVAALICGVARQILQLGIDTLGEREHVVNLDTDGIKSDYEIEIEELNRITDEYVVNTLKGKPVIKWEKDPYKAIYSHRAKNYLVLNMDGTVDKKGVAFHSSKMPELFDKVINGIAPAMLQLGHSSTKHLVKKYYDLSMYENSDFVQRVRAAKNYDEYVSKSSQVPQLLLKYKELMGRMPKSGTVMPFVKTTRGYEPPSEEAFKRLDRNYYRNIVDDAVKLCGYKQGINSQLNAFGVEIL